MPLPWFEVEIRRAREEQAEHDWEEYVNAVNDAWEELTTLPATVFIMGTPFTFDSTGMPPWVNTQEPPDALQGTDGQLSVPQTQPATAPTSGSVVIGITQSTTTAIPTATGSPGASSGATITSPLPATTSAAASGTNSASPSKSTCSSTTSPSGSDRYSEGAALTSGIGGYPDSNGGVTNPPGPNNGGDSSGGGPPLGLILAAVIIPLLVITLLAITVFIVLRRRKQRRDAENASPSEEMKLRLSDDFPPPGPPPGEPPVPSREPTPPQAPPRAVTPATPPPPVIVSAMNPASNSSYFTGIDTSEALSVRTNSVRSGPRQAGFMLDGEFHEEPPPPYRPRSVPPISRDSSMRTNNRADCASTYLMADESRPVNPFADPSDDDNDSIVSGVGPYHRRTDDHLSVVSDISYQNEPTAVRQAV